jgi:DNA uptake protein ComE-like DNA-binding protein
MKLPTEPIKNWFGFSRRERRATFILLILIVIIIGLRYTVPNSRLSVRDITGTVISAEELAGFSKPENTSEQTGISYNTKKEYKVKYRQNGFSDYKAVNVGGRLLRRENSAKYSPVQKRSLTDLNLSDSAALVRLPGIGPVLSARIIKYRKLLGGFARIEQLKEVYGLSSETFELIKEIVFADSTFISRININTAVYKELTRLHYLEKYEITAILKYRQLRGRINNIGDLTDNKLISVEKAIKVRPYLKFD